MFSIANNLINLVKIKTLMCQKRYHSEIAAKLNEPMKMI